MMPVAVGVAVLVLLAALAYFLNRPAAPDSAEPQSIKEQESESLATAAGPGVSVEPDAYRWLIGGWGYGNCTSIVNIGQGSAGITIAWGSGAPTAYRVTAANETTVATAPYRFVRDQDGVEWYSGDQMLIRLVPCPNGQETL